jgi:hypothetical protein
MKKLALISSFCDDENKINVLVSNIKKLKEMNFDVLLLSPIHLDINVTRYCDYYFFTKDNPVYNWPFRGWNFWRTFYLDGKYIKISKTVSDYGWASLNQIKQLNAIALNLDYDYYYHLIYDLKIDENVIKYFLEPKERLVFPSKRGETIWNTGLHLMIFNKNYLALFNSHIREESYNSIEEEQSVFDWLLKVVKIIPLRVAETPVEDEIYLYEKEDIFNYSTEKSFKFFIDKNDKTLEPIKILFYDIKEELKLLVPQENIIIDINQDCIIELGFNKFDMKQVLLQVNEKISDITKLISEVKHNTLEFL